MISLILSIFALLTGVLIYPVIRQRPSLLSFFDAFALLSIIGLTLLHLIPHSVEGGGTWGLLAVMIGFGLPALLHVSQRHGEHDEHDEHDHEGHPHPILLVIVFIGVVIHTLLDGIGLSMSGNAASGNMIGLGVLFHRLPVGLFLGMMLVPRIGLKKTWAVVLTFVMTTLLGFGLGHVALPHLGIQLMNILQGLIAGTLLHILFHNVSPDGKNGKSWPKGLGALCGLGALFIIEWLAPEHGHHHASVLDIWLSYLLNGAPFWCGFAIVLFAAYKGIGASNATVSRISREITVYLDPQPLPALSGGKNHVLAATGMILLCTLCILPFAVSWEILVILCFAMASLLVVRHDVCQNCHRDIFCDQEKSFGIWTGTSFTLISLVVLIASLMPSVVLPFSEWIHDSYTCDIALIAIIVIGLIYSYLRRGFQLAGSILAMVVASSIVGHRIEGTFGFVLIALLGAILCWFYDFHPKDIDDSDQKWKRRYVLISTCMIVLFPLVMGASIFCEPFHEVSVPFQIVEHNHDHEHHEELGIHGHDHEHHEELGIHGHDHEHHEELGFHKHNYERHEELGIHDHIHEHHDEIIDLDHREGLVIHDHHGDEMIAYDHSHHALSNHLGIFKHSIFKSICLLLFFIAGLFWLIRLGPRDLFKMAMGKSHHHHD